MLKGPAWDLITAYCLRAPPGILLFVNPLMLQRPRFGILLLTLSSVNVGFFCLSLQTIFPVIFTALQESVLSILTLLVFRLNLT